MTGTPPSAGSSAAIAVQYELLRSAALGEAVPLKARSGLLLFLRRGMWGWVRALNGPAGLSREQMCPAATPSVHPGHRVVVHVLAAIAMGIHDRRSA